MKKTGPTVLGDLNNSHVGKKRGWDSVSKGVSGVEPWMCITKNVPINSEGGKKKGESRNQKIRTNFSVWSGVRFESLAQKGLFEAKARQTYEGEKRGWDRIVYTLWVLIGGELIRN